MVRRIGWTFALAWVCACSDDGVPANGSSEGSSSEGTGGPTTTSTTNPSSDTSSDTSSSSTSVDPSSSSDPTTSTGPATESSSSEGTGSSSGSESSSSESSSSVSGVTTSEESSSNVTGTDTDGDSATATGGSSSGPFEPDLPDVVDCNTYDDECPAGEKCNAFSAFGGGWDALACFPLDPAPADEGDACVVESAATSGIDNCAQGAICWNVDPVTLTGTCVSYCQGTPDMPTCANGSPCTIANDGVLNLCLPPCDPLLQDCGGGQLCVPVNDTFVCAPDAGLGAYPAGTACDYINVCNLGLTCAEAALVPGCVGGFGCCTPYCDVADPTASATCDATIDGTDCVPFYDEGSAPPGYEDVGSCLGA